MVPFETEKKLKSEVPFEAEKKLKSEVPFETEKKLKSAEGGLVLGRYEVF